MSNPSVFLGRTVDFDVASSLRLEKVATFVASLRLTNTDGAFFIRKLSSTMLLPPLMYNIVGLEKSVSVA